MMGCLIYRAAWIVVSALNALHRAACAVNFPINNWIRRREKAMIDWGWEEKQ